MQETILSEEQLQEMLKYWQEKLRLQDWIIEVKVRRERDMMQDSLACVNWTLSKKMATISILDQVDYDPSFIWVRDMENDLVHELLHLQLAPISDHFKDNEFYSTFEEQAIESIASGLIALERKSST
ncbi:hypothetical protein GMD78_12245 [Ornithinibacillus sp. L9]|uniref:Uncharacterized protein n=1 Tax=Ornithinibacillus caprae TaxID=2678566 RepID=A0A6N8FLA7_9BACI|nr:hypothetical protein [Ornithinibacillus caprae]MUK89144.1 hypothetical protein [Ornithinibacillus caprae]